MTQTFVEMGVSDATYHEIEEQLQDAGYDYQAVDGGLALHGIHLVRGDPTPTTELSNEKQLRIDYTNHRGERRWRTIEPVLMWHGTTIHHPEPQWFWKAVDVEKDAVRDFAVLSIHATSR